MLAVAKGINGKRPMEVKAALIDIAAVFTEENKQKPNQVKTAQNGVQQKKRTMDQVVPKSQDTV